MYILLQQISFVITLVTCAILGVLVLIRSPWKKNNRKFALIIASIILWVGSAFVYYLVTSDFWLLWLARIALAFAILIPFTSFTFIETFSTAAIRISRWISWTVYGLIALFFGLCFTPLLDKSEHFNGYERVEVYGPFYGIYLLVIALVCAICIGVLVLKWKKVTGIYRAQVMFFLLGFASLTFIALLFNGILPYLFNNYYFQAFGSLAAVGFVGFTSYAMIRYRFMDINRLLSNVLANLAKFILLGLLYFFAAYVIGYFFFPALLQIRYIFVTVVSVLLIRFFVLDPLTGSFQKIGQSIFAKNLYNRSQLFQEVTGIISSTIDMAKLITEVLTEIKVRMDITSIMYVSALNNKILVVDVSKRKKRSGRLFSESELHIFMDIKEVVTIDELSEESVIRKALIKRKAEVIVPLQTTKTYTRFMLLGRKKSGNPYYLYDIETLQLLTQPFLIAIQNAQYLYDAKQFNKTLKQEVVKATKEVRRVNNQLRQADKLKDEFISIASHELKTPTTAIQGFLWLVLQKDKELSSYSREKIERVAKLTEHMTTLINDMLDVSKIESKRISLHPEAFDMRGLVEEVKGELDLFAIQKSLQIQIANGGSYVVWADRQRMHQVVSNLMNNALKYTPGGGKIKVSLSSKDSQVAISVTDTGIGIREDDIPKLFTKFGKLDGTNSPTANLPGTGLGLYITKHLIELSGGNISVKSRYGKGSTFIFTVPSRQ